LNLEQLEAIQAIVEKGSFRAAADALRRSQPALSAAVKNLEDEFSIQIFDRSNYRPVLTEAGTVFLSYAQKTLESAKHASRIAMELGQKKAETKIRISIDPLVGLEAIELIAEECARPTVPVGLILEKTILHHSHSLLREGAIDLALAMCPEDPAIEKILIEKVSLVGAISRKLLQERKNADEAFLSRHAQVFTYDKTFDEPEGEVSTKSPLDRMGPKIFVPDHFTKLRLIEGGLGWGRISLSEFEKRDDLVLIPKKICEPISLELCLLRPKHRPIGPIARRIWTVFEKRQGKIK
jgi:DNA-binding transcriptional LysR family regulator